MVTLEKISSGNVHAVLSLEVSEDQKTTYPRSNAYSIAEGMFTSDGDLVRMRAICSNGKPIGFMMTSEIPQEGAYFLWRMMIDAHDQGKGYGSEAMRLLIKRIEDSRNPKVLLLSHLKANVEAGRFYRGFGFAYTGNDLGDRELEMSLDFR